MDRRIPREGRSFLRYAAKLSLVSQARNAMVLPSAEGKVVNLGLQAEVSEEVYQEQSGPWCVSWALIGRILNITEALIVATCSL